MMDSSFFERNRSKLKEQLGTAPIVVTAYTEMQRRADTTFPFQQAAHFLWLTGIKEANWKLVIDAKSSYLVAPDYDEVYVTFNGGVSAEEAQNISGVDEVVSEKEYRARIAQLSKQHSKVYTVVEDHIPKREFTHNPQPYAVQNYLRRHFATVENCQLQLAQLRAIKQPEEIQALKEAIAVSARGFEEIKAQQNNLKHEYEVEALLHHAFRFSGADGHAYDPIIASGKNACTLHYVQNNDPLNTNELLLIDAGAQVDGYAADITRTYALSTPTKRQSEVHEAVQTAQTKIIELIAPGVPLQQYIDTSNEIMKDALMKVGLLKDRNDKQTFRKYFPHAVSHGLGLDVHESLGGYKEFKSGMVLTVEPGIYIPEEGIGVRIEDDILVTETGNENLSEALSTSL